jgi:hypothetical protein
MESSIVCAASDGLLSDCSLSFRDSSFFVMAQSENLADISSAFTKIVSLNPRHIFICGDYWKDAENMLLDILSPLNNRKFLFSTYDHLDADSIWDFLYLNRFEFIEKFKVFIPLCTNKEQISEIYGIFFSTLSLVISDNP